MTLYEEITRKSKTEGKIEGKLEGKLEGKTEVILNGYDQGLDISILSNITQMKEEEVREIIRQHRKS